MKKQLVLDVIENMPEEFSIEDLISQVKFMETMERGRQQYREGKTLTHEEVKRRFSTRIGQNSDSEPFGN